MGKRPEGHPTSYLDFGTGEICQGSSVNVADAFSIGKAHRDDFEKSLPSSFYKPLGQKVKNIATAKRKSRSNNKKEDYKLLGTLIPKTYEAIMNYRFYPYGYSNLQETCELETISDNLSIRLR